MKKVLLGTSALIAAAAVSAPAMAQEQIQLGIGGKMEQYFGVTSMDDNDYTGVPATVESTSTGINTDTEVYFTGATTLDNGLTVGAVIQLEAGVGAAGADEQYAYIEGAFGQIVAGQRNGVNGILAHDAPQFGIAETDVMGFVTWNGVANNHFNPAGYTQNYFRGATSGTFTDTTISSDDASVSYITPTLAGFSAGLTWTPNPGGALQADQNAGSSNQWEAAIAYNGEFSGVGIGADVAYITDDGQNVPGGTDADDQTMWRAGLVLSYAGFQLGGSYMNVDDVNRTASTPTVAFEDEHTAWNVGAGYETGPYGVSVTYSRAILDFDSAAAGVAQIDEDSYEQVMLNGTYDLGPGITAAGSVFWAEGERDFNAVANTAGTADVSRDGTGGIVALQLSF
ncbi:hypothetical protein C882_3256 [Caenispirillum salinarum AK4]|uniref:Porin domain-containing protein n=1 Tax=Caenispirillum salinarum AK4 TaxID=1238182 RepID=K9H3R7_9PROT|nr:porin [Caenispirillum salinarum]EKV32192.1 hypothetical protein C882_3256 [Caenispirillum salinarum AK4]